MKKINNEQQANEKADALVQNLKHSIGGNWYKEVWENLGYHYCASLGTMWVYEREHDDGSRYYTCLIGDTEHAHAGLGVFHVPNASPTPYEAVIASMEAARKYLAKINTIIANNLKEIYGE